ncbi:MAG TPA: hypothetical protein VLM85_22970 [Polyangiaceae bacterium]|nr:hypothetical protein [Polyangiaceae bacterium]
MPSAAEFVSKVLPESATLQPAEVDAILEIAYLTIAADRRLTNEELAAFEVLLDRLRTLSGMTGPVSRATLDGTLNDMYARADRARESSRSGYDDAQLQQLGAKLGPAAREIAYKVAYALGLADMDAIDEEFELDLQLVDALELSNDRSEALANEVLAALTPRD